MNCFYTPQGNKKKIIIIDLETLVTIVPYTIIFVKQFPLIQLRFFFSHLFINYKRKQPLKPNVYK